MKNLSKSKLLAYRQCAKRLWLEVHKRQENVVSAKTQAAFDVGHRIGSLAQQLYDTNGDAILIEPFVEGWPAAFRRTREMISGDKPIFEATFSGGGVLALADMVLPAGNGTWNMVEVKSSTGVKDYHRLDVAVQMYAARAAGIKLNKIALACINSSWVYPGGEDYAGILFETDLTDEALHNQDQVAVMVGAAQEIANSPQEPNIAIGPHCSDPFECGFYSYCSRDLKVPEHPVDWLPNLRKRDLKEYIAANSVSEMEQVPDSLLTPQQLRVKQCTLSGETYFDAGAVCDELAEQGWPAYFVDFETINFAIPIWPGTHPYQQVPYQFSCHVVTATGQLNHSDFLDISGNDPRREFARQLIDSCGKTGPVYVYNLAFESGVIMRLAAQFEDLSEQLYAINQRLVDLLPLARDYYYHPGQEGSWSIKKLLPTIAPELDYSTLEGVQDGTMASRVFEEAIDANTTADRRAVLQGQLRNYCGLDTYAMVALWRFFLGMKMPGETWQLSAI